jgi:hypothetical protein
VLNLTRLRVLAAVAEHGSVTAAAKARAFAPFEDAISIGRPSLGGHGSAGWADALADRAREWLLAAGQFSGPVASAVAARTEKFLALRDGEPAGPARSLVFGVSTPGHLLGPCLSNRWGRDMGGS